MAGSYQKLIVWQKAMELVFEIYRVTKKFPGDELFGLTSQLRRAAVSIPSNVAEGQGRRLKGEFQQFIGQARGSLYEVETQTLIAEKLGYLNGTDAEVILNLTTEVGRTLNGLLASLKK